MLERRLDAVLLSAPENIFYLTGLDHWGYFAPHMLIVPLQGEVVLVTRAMERVTIANQVRNARFEGHGDHETAARSEEHTSELQSPMRSSYDVVCLNKKKKS